MGPLIGKDQSPSQPSQLRLLLQTSQIIASAPLENVSILRYQSHCSQRLHANMMCRDRLRQRLESTRLHVQPPLRKMYSTVISLSSFSLVIIGAMGGHVGHFMPSSVQEETLLWSLSSARFRPKQAGTPRKTFRNLVR